MMAKMIKLTGDRGNAYIRHDTVYAALPPILHTLGTRVYFGRDRTCVVVRETPDEVLALITAAYEEEERENEEARAAEEAKRSTPDPKYPAFEYTADDRYSRLNAAIAVLNREGGVLYDDGRYFIVADSDDYAEGRRVSGDELSENEVEAALDWLEDNDFDWSCPIDKTALLGAAANATSEGDPWTAEEEDGEE